MSQNAFTFIDWFEILVFFGLFLALTPSLGKYIANVLEGKSTFLSPLMQPFEKWTYAFAKIDPLEEMTPGKYAKSFFTFAFASAALAYGVLAFQGFLPLNPQGFPGLSWDKALNTAVSYVTGTHWQPYAPETHLSYLSHMLGATLQSFFSGAMGLAVLAAFARGFSRNKENSLGSFWVDFVRSILYVFLPLAAVLALCLIVQGVVQTFNPYAATTTLEGQQQVIPLGPAATEIAIAQLSAAGGGFFNVGRSHPLENPSALSNFFECLAMLLIPGAAPFVFGNMTNSKGRGLWIFAVMFCLWLGGLSVALWSDHQVLEGLKGNALVEGKEARIGIANSVLWLTIGSATGNGSLNSTLGSSTPLTQAVSLFNLLIGNVIYGPPGLGICGFFLFIGLAVFLAGLLVGRTPEYLGKQIEWPEMRWIAVGLFVPGMAILLITAYLTSHFGIGHSAGEFTELAYGVASLVRLNGSKLGSLNVDTPAFNLGSAALMLGGWLLALAPPLAIAGKMVAKRIYPKTSTEFDLLNWRLALLLFFMILSFAFIVFMPLLLMGPLAQELRLYMEGG